MVDPKAFLKAALQLHGHECPDLILGLRAGAAAMNRLGVERSAEGQLLALVQFPQGRRCFADGVQAITGCTLRKGNVRVEGQGPLSLTLVEQATRRAVRVAREGGLATATPTCRGGGGASPAPADRPGEAGPLGGRGVPDRRGIDRGQGRREGRGLASNHGDA